MRGALYESFGSIWRRSTATRSDLTKPSDPSAEHVTKKRQRVAPSGFRSGSGDSQAKICQALAQGVRGYLLLGCSLQDLVAGIRSVHEGGVALTPHVASRLAESLNQEALTAKEQTVLRQMTFGWSNKRIAGELGMAVGTVKSHAKAIFARLAARNRGEAIAIARRRGILPDAIEWQEPCGAKGLPHVALQSEGCAPRNGVAVPPLFGAARFNGKSGDRSA